MMQSTFGRDRDQRKLLFRNLATSVILYESVITTEDKARAIQPIVERIIRLGQDSDTLTTRRLLRSYLADENAITKVLNELSGRFNDRTSGFTRRIHMPPRAGDGAPRVMLQLTKTAILPEHQMQPVPAASTDNQVTEEPEVGEE